MEFEKLRRGATVSCSEAPGVFVSSCRLLSSYRLNTDWYPWIASLSAPVADKRLRCKHLEGHDSSSTDEPSSSTGARGLVSRWTGNSLLNRILLLGKFFGAGVSEIHCSEQADLILSAPPSASSSIPSTSRKTAATGGDVTASARATKRESFAKSEDPVCPPALCSLSSTLLQNTYATRWKDYLYMLVWQHSTLYCYMVPLHPTDNSCSKHVTLFVYDVAVCGWPGSLTHAYVDAGKNLLLVVLAPDASSTSLPHQHMLDSEGRITLLFHFSPLEQHCARQKGHRKPERRCYRNAAFSLRADVPLIPFSLPCAHIATRDNQESAVATSGADTDFLRARDRLYVDGSPSKNLSQNSCKGSKEDENSATLDLQWLPVTHMVVVPAPVFGATAMFSCSAGLLLFSCSPRRTFHKDRQASLLLLSFSELQHYFSLKKPLQSFSGCHRVRNFSASRRQEVAGPMPSGTSFISSSVPSCRSLSGPQFVSYSEGEAAQDSPEQSYGRDFYGSNENEHGQHDHMRREKQQLEELPLSYFSSEHLPGLPCFPSSFAVDEASQRLLLAGFCSEQQRPWLAIACWRSFCLELDEAEYHSPHRIQGDSPTYASAATSLAASHDSISSSSRASATSSAISSSNLPSHVYEDRDPPSPASHQDAASERKIFFQTENLSEWANAENEEKDDCPQKDLPALVMLPRLSSLRTAAKIAATLRRAAALKEAAGCTRGSSSSSSGIFSQQQQHLSQQQICSQQPMLSQQQPQQQMPLEHEQQQQQQQEPLRQSKHQYLQRAAVLADRPPDGSEGSSSISATAVDSHYNVEEKEITNEEINGISDSWKAAFYHPLKVENMWKLLQQLHASGELHPRLPGNSYYYNSNSSSGAALLSHEANKSRAAAADPNENEGEGGESSAGLIGSALKWASSQLHSGRDEEPTEVVHIAVSTFGSRIALSFSSGEVLLLRRTLSSTKNGVSRTSVGRPAPAEAAYTSAAAAAVFTGAASPHSHEDSSSSSRSNIPVGASACLSYSLARRRSDAASTAAGVEEKAAAKSNTNECTCDSYSSSSSETSSSRFPYEPWLYFPAAYITYLRITAHLDAFAADGKIAAACPRCDAAAAAAKKEERKTYASYMLTSVLREKQDFDGLIGVLGTYFESHLRSTKRGFHSCGVRTSHEEERGHRQSKREGRGDKGIRGGRDRNVAARRAAADAASFADVADEEEEEVLVVVLGPRASKKMLQGLYSQQAVATSSAAEIYSAATAAATLKRDREMINNATFGRAFSASPSLSVDVCAIDLRAAAAAAEASLADIMTLAAANPDATLAAPGAAAKQQREGEDGKEEILSQHAGQGVLLLNAAAEGGSERWFCSCVLPDAHGAVGLALLLPQQQELFDTSNLTGQTSAIGIQRNNKTPSASFWKTADAYSGHRLGLYAAKENNVQQQGLVLLTLEEIDLDTDSVDENSVAEISATTGNAAGSSLGAAGSPAASVDPAAAGTAVAGTAVAGTAVAIADTGRAIAETTAAAGIAVDDATCFLGFKAPPVDATAGRSTLAESVAAVHSSCQENLKIKKKGWQRLCVWEIVAEDAQAHVKKLMQQQRYIEAERICCNALLHLASFPPTQKCSLCQQQRHGTWHQQLQQEEMEKAASPRDYLVLLEAVRAARWKSYGSFPEAAETDFSVS